MLSWPATGMTRNWVTTGVEEEAIVKPGAERKESAWVCFRPSDGR
jgi:hypothetical protein